MSILGITAVGVAVNGFIYDYSKDQYEKAISRLENLVKQLDSHLTKLRELRTNVPNFWEDEDAKATCTALDMTIDRIVFDMDTCKDLISAYQTAMAEFDISKSKTTQLLTDALAILKGISG